MALAMLLMRKVPDQGPGGFDLGAKLHYKLFLGHLDRGEASIGTGLFLRLR